MWPKVFLPRVDKLAEWDNCVRSPQFEMLFGSNSGPQPESCPGENLGVVQVVNLCDSVRIHECLGTLIVFSILNKQS